MQLTIHRMRIGFAAKNVVRVKVIFIAGATRRCLESIWFSVPSRRTAEMKNGTILSAWDWKKKTYQVFDIQDYQHNYDLTIHLFY